METHVGEGGKVLCFDANTKEQWCSQSLGCLWVTIDVVWRAMAPVSDMHKNKALKFESCVYSDLHVWMAKYHYHQPWKFVCHGTMTTAGQYTYSRKQTSLQHFIAAPWNKQRRFSNTTWRHIENNNGVYTTIITWDATYTKFLKHELTKQIKRHFWSPGSRVVTLGKWTPCW